MKKDITADWRKHFHNDYKIGRLSYESKMVQWTHIMMLDEMFELQKRGECLTKSSAIKRYGEKKVNHLINKNHIKEEFKPGPHNGIDFKELVKAISFKNSPEDDTTQLPS